ncbi:hypothetical protein KIW84_025569 [Lathyrus oleraceus]|uniref:Pentatricopeptide repeat-containing protein n=1 Tax=Pisum sativum TaxID=3888 RepID=A0A9D4YIN1_PEA|nr:hypothetical protein KIW84_025569 [Pisum sativum]
MLVVHALLDMYLNCGDMCAAKGSFDEFSDKNLVVYNTIMSNYVQHGMAGEVLVVLVENQIRNELESWDNISNAIIDMYMKCGKRKTACKVFDSMSNKTVSNLVSWNTMIGVTAMVQANIFEEAIGFFKETQNQGISAHYADKKITQLALHRVGTQMLLSDIYAPAGKWTDVARVREQMKEKGFQKVPWSSSIEVFRLIREFTSGDESHTVIELILRELNCTLSQVGYVPDTTNVLILMNRGKGICSADIVKNLSWLID